jgi:hypothetical protein
VPSHGVEAGRSGGAAQATAHEPVGDAATVPVSDILQDADRHVG